MPRKKQEPIDAGRFRARVTSVMRSRGLWMETEEVMRPLIPQDEAERLVEFRLSTAVDSEPEERFDKISRMAQRVFSVPFAGVSFVEGERQWFKSKQGLPIGDSARELSFCGHAITGTEVFVVKIDEKIYAMGNTCTHAGGPLNEGKWVGGDRCEIQCPWHGSVFCAKDGSVTSC